MTSVARHWLYEWMDAHAVRSLEDALRLYEDASAKADLLDRANDATTHVADPVPAGDGVVAGRGFDLSPDFDCEHPEHNRERINELFFRIWHYFDFIVVDDVLTHLFQHGFAHGVPYGLHSEGARWGIFEPSPGYTFKHGFHRQVELLLYIREIGAEDLLVFRPKPTVDDLGDWQPVAEAEGLGFVAAAVSERAELLTKDAVVEHASLQSGWVKTAVYHPNFEGRRTLLLAPEEVGRLSARELERYAVERVLEIHLGFLAADLLAARRFATPLGALLGIHRDVLEKNTERSAARVALQLQLPVLHGIDPKRLVQLRRAEGDAFRRFKIALRQATEELLKARPDDDAARIAADLRHDLIEPALADIREQMRRSEKSLARDLGRGLVLASLATGVGYAGAISGSAPLAVAAGVATAVLSQAIDVAMRDAERVANIANQDMYFMWQASELLH